MPVLTLDNNDPRLDMDRVTHLRSEAGSWYAVVGVRRVNSRVHPSRWKVRTERIAEPDELGEHDFVMEFWWHSRDRRRGV